MGRSPRKETKSESDFLTFLPGVAEASTLLSEGYLKALVDDVAKLPDYWQHFLEDYPGHMVRLRDRLHSLLCLARGPNKSISVSFTFCLQMFARKNHQKIIYEMHFPHR